MQRFAIPSDPGHASSCDFTITVNRVLCKGLHNSVANVCACDTQNPRHPGHRGESGEGYDDERSAVLRIDGSLGDGAGKCTGLCADGPGSDPGDPGRGNSRCRCVQRGHRRHRDQRRAVTLPQLDLGVAGQPGGNPELHPALDRRNPAQHSRSSAQRHGGSGRQRQYRRARYPGVDGRFGICLAAGRRPARRAVRRHQLRQQRLLAALRPEYQDGRGGARRFGLDLRQPGPARSSTSSARPAT